jgi:Tfp pilus assembly protein PilO
MLKSFNVWPPNNPRSVIRLVLGVLLVANLVAAYFVIRPIGGSPAELRQQASDLRTQISQQRNSLERTRVLVGKIEAGRGEGDQFMNKYFLLRRTANSIIMNELADLAAQAKVTPKEASIVFDPVDGSDTLDRMQITANFEGSYVDLIHLVNLIDKTKRLLVLESMNATPQQGVNAKLNVMLKLDTFVIEDGSGI